MSKHISTEITIAAPTQVVWEVLTDFAKYEEWNPFVTSISGPLEIGSQLDVCIQPPESKPFQFKPQVLNATPNQELRWQGKFLVKGLFDGEHYFKLTPTNNGDTLLSHGESFSGLLVPLLGGMLKNTQQGFMHLNQALKDRAESLASA